MGDDCDADFELNPDDCSDRRSFGSADKRNGADVDAAVVERKESVAVAVEMGVSSERILGETADTPAKVLLPRDDADERSSHLVEQKTWE